jgi:hypothetical protein
MKTTHTHRGHCQMCGSVQAIDNATGGVAKHGYTTTWGYFNGTCPGSDSKSLHLSRSMTDGLIHRLYCDAARNDELIADYEAGTLLPEYAGTGVTTRVQSPVTLRSTLVEERVKWADASDYQKARELRKIVETLRFDALRYRDGAKQMQALADRVYGTEPMPASVKGAPLKVGDVTTRGPILEIVDRVAVGRGPHLNGRTMPHARLKHPTLHDYWYPVRLLKRPK